MKAARKYAENSHMREKSLNSVSRYNKTKIVEPHFKSKFRIKTSSLMKNSGVLNFADYTPRDNNPTKRGSGKTKIDNVIYDPKYTLVRKKVASIKLATHFEDMDYE